MAIFAIKNTTFGPKNGIFHCFPAKNPLSACSIASIKISDMHLLFSRIIFITTNKKLSVRNMKNRRMQSGFTLIELVVVIAILGILAAVALPKFAALQTEARIAKMNGALGSIKAAAVLAHSVQLTQQLAPGAQVLMEGSYIEMANGYPTSSYIGIAAGLDDDFVWASAETIFTVTPDTAHAACAVIYTMPAAGFPPSYSNAGLTATNCQ